MWYYSDIMSRPPEALAAQLMLYTALGGHFVPNNEPFGNPQTLNGLATATYLKGKPSSVTTDGNLGSTEYTYSPSWERELESTITTKKIQLRGLIQLYKSDEDELD